MERAAAARCHVLSALFALFAAQYSRWMADPLTLSVVGGWAALEGIKFLYGQAAEVLKGWREHRLDVPIQASEALDGVPVQRPPDAEVLGQQAKTLGELAGGLAPYATGMLDVDLHDAALGERAAEVRAILEAVYGQRFTFRGEERDSTGTRVRVDQVLGEVEGTVVGVEGDAGPGADVKVRQSAHTVEKDGSMTGFKGKIGP